MSKMYSTARWAVALLLSVWLAFAFQLNEAKAQSFLPPDTAFELSTTMITPEEVGVHFKIAPEYKMYEARFGFELDGEDVTDADILFPVSVLEYDVTFDKDMPVFRDSVTIQIPVSNEDVAQGASVPFTIHYQGCADGGLCYPPEGRTVTLTATYNGFEMSGEWASDSIPNVQDRVEIERTPASEANSQGSGISNAMSLSDTGLAGYLAESSWIEMVVLAFAFGLFLSFTPCVLPMVPILLSIIAGQNIKETDSRWKGLSLAAAYVLGMSIVYTLLGIAAGVAGSSLAAVLQTPWVLATFALILGVLALSMFDVYNLQVPAGFQSRLQGRLSKLPGGRYSGVFFMGMFSALIVGPCVAAPLAGVLLFISQTGDLVLGGASLFALAWGSGTLLLLVGASSGALLPKAGAWMNGVKYGFGIMLLATSLWMVNSVLPTWALMLGWASLAIWSAVLLGAFRSLESSAGVFTQLLKGLGILVAVWAIALTVGVASGNKSILTPLAGLGGASSSSTQSTVAAPSFQVVASNSELDEVLATTSQPVLLDFYADWCSSCVEMERFTFTDEAVAKNMSEMTLVQVDVTKNSKEGRELLKRFDLFGPPGVIFFDANGTELTDIRVVGFKPAAEFNSELEKVLAATP